MEEIFDTFDKNGNFLGVKSKSFCHSENPGVYHKPVWIWIKDATGREILVQKRASTKKNNPGLWDMPSAGHVDAGETCLQGCVRETFEELGIKVPQKQFRFLGQYLYQKGWELAQLYLLNISKDTKFKLQETEVEQVRWLKYDDFIKLLYSDKFCPHEKEYKDYVAKILK